MTKVTARAGQSKQRLREAETVLAAATGAGYRVVANGSGLVVERPPDMSAKRALSFSLAISEFRIEIMALILAEREGEAP